MCSRVSPSVTTPLGTLNIVDEGAVCFQSGGKNRGHFQKEFRSQQGPRFAQIKRKR